MKITMKKIKVMASLSEETNCYSADLYVDGKRIGEVSNRGQGGPDEFHGDHADLAKAEAWVAANHPAITYGEDSSFPCSIEIICGDLIDEHLITKHLKKHLKKSVLFVNADKTEVREVGFKNVRAVTDAHVDFVRKKNPGIQILNTLPFDEALALYKAHT